MLKPTRPAFSTALTGIAASCCGRKLSLSQSSKRNTAKTAGRARPRRWTASASTSASTMLAQFRVYCYDYDGNKLWKKNPGEFHSVHGFCSPPMLYKDLVIVNGDQDAPKCSGVHRRVRQETRRGEVAHRPAQPPPFVLSAGHRRRRRQEADGPDRQQVRRQLRSRHRQADSGSSTAPRSSSFPAW